MGLDKTVVLLVYSGTFLFSDATVSVEIEKQLENVIETFSLLFSPLRSKVN